MRLPVVQLKQWPQTSAANEVEGISTFGFHNLRHVVASNHANPNLHNPSEFHCCTRFGKNKWLKHVWGEVIHKGKSPSAISIYISWQNASCLNKMLGHRVASNSTTLQNHYHYRDTEHKLYPTKTKTSHLTSCSNELLSVSPYVKWLDMKH